MSDAEKISKLRQRLISTDPIHDTPIGVVHPYWARKPMNIIEIIIETLTDEGDVVMDPFMGSGTTVFAGLKQNRQVVGTDLNPLSSFIVNECLQLSRIGIYQTLEDFVKSAEIELLPLFRIDGDKYVERERFVVEGNYEDGQFALKLIETVSKKREVESWKGRQIESDPFNISIDKKWEAYIESPFNFTESELMYNSRIAIPRGANLSHYFTDVNKICINFLLTWIENECTSGIEKNACRFLLSSSLPLLRLSDKKASSQWPYWRPKNNLTSRNPLVVLRDRLKKVHEGIKWLEQNELFDYLDRIHSIMSGCDSDILVGQVAIQEVSKYVKKRPKLILTDPPYTDHVPYLEYSAYWNKILGLEVDDRAFDFEIVNSDAPERKKDSEDYSNRLTEALFWCSDLIDDDGYIVWFYQDQDFNNWQLLYDTAKSNGLNVVEVIHIQKQRRSIKTVTTPGRTLDGDLILIFSKNLNSTPIITSHLATGNSAIEDHYSEYLKKIRNGMLEGNIKSK